MDEWNDSAVMRNVNMQRIADEYNALVSKCEDLEEKVAALTMERDEYKTIWENEYRLRCEAQARIVELRFEFEYYIDHMDVARARLMLYPPDDSSTLVEQAYAQPRLFEDAKVGAGDTAVQGDMLLPANAELRGGPAVSSPERPA